MTCAVCGNGDRVPATRPYVEEKNGRVAVVTQTWLDGPVARALDVLLTDMLSHDILGVRGFDYPATAA